MSGKMRKTIVTCAPRAWMMMAMCAVLAWPSIGRADESVARQWSEAILSAIRIDFPNPPVHARNLYHFSATMYDTWATFDDQAQGVFYTDKAPAPADIEAARNEAISYAAYRILSHRYALSVNPTGSQTIFDNVMNTLGYDPMVTTTVGDSPAAIGNRVAAFVIGSTINDGSNEVNKYVDNSGYMPVNAPLTLPFTGIEPLVVADPNRWQPLAFDVALTQNGLEADKIQKYVGPHWGAVTTFALHSEPGDPHSWSSVDPGPPPLLGGVGDAKFKTDVLSVIAHSAVLDPNATTIVAQTSIADANPGESPLIDVSPASRGNRPLGTHTDQGYDVNPVTGQPYTPQFVHVGDYGRILAEFWADGPHSETPPGHWFSLANDVADHPLTIKKIGGVGPVVDDLEWDVKTYLSIGGAVHDSAVAAWGAKRVYDYVRPITMIRYMGQLGQSSDPAGPSYNPNGLPLQPGLVEVITAESSASGERHEHLAAHVGEIAIYAWTGAGEVAEGEVAGSGWIRAVEWFPYQRSTFVTPAFAAYVSGHSTFSRSAAEVLAGITGSPFFPGGLSDYYFPQHMALEFEDGPTNSDVTLQWATYYDAADEAGISRLFGGIHVASDDFGGRIIGSQVGMGALDHALFALFYPDFVTGDTTLDGVLNADDIDALHALVHMNSTSPFADLNNDGAADGLDVTALVEGELDTRSGDVNLDGSVDITDLAALASFFGAGNDTTGWAQGNLNGLGGVNISDLALLASYFGFERSAGAGGNDVPEPATIALLAAGGWLMRRRRAARA